MCQMIKMVHIIFRRVSPHSIFVAHSQNHISGPFMYIEMVFSTVYSRAHTSSLPIVYVKWSKWWILYSGWSTHIQYLLPLLKIISENHSHTLTLYSAHFTAGHNLLLFQLYMSYFEYFGYYIQEDQPTFNTCCPFSKSYLRTFHIHWHYILHILQQGTPFFPSNCICHVLNLLDIIFRRVNPHSILVAPSQNHIWEHFTFIDIIFLPFYSRAHTSSLPIVYVIFWIFWILHSGWSTHIQYLLPLLKIISENNSHSLTLYSAHFTAGHTLLLFQLYMSYFEYFEYYIQEGQPTFITCCPFSKSYLRTIHIHWHYILHILQQGTPFFPSNCICHVLNLLDIIFRRVNPHSLLVAPSQNHIWEQFTFIDIIFCTFYSRAHTSSLPMVYVIFWIFWILYSGWSTHIQYLLPLLKTRSENHSHTLTLYSAHFAAGHTLLLFQLYMPYSEYFGYYIHDGQPTFNTCCPFLKSYLRTIHIHWHYILHILQQGTHFFPSNYICQMIKMVHIIFKRVSPHSILVAPSQNHIWEPFTYIDIIFCTFYGRVHPSSLPIVYVMFWIFWILYSGWSTHIQYMLPLLKIRSENHSHALTLYFAHFTAGRALLLFQLNISYSEYFGYYIQEGRPTFNTWCLFSESYLMTIHIHWRYILHILQQGTHFSCCNWICQMITMVDIIFRRASPHSILVAHSQNHISWPFTYIEIIFCTFYSGVHTSLPIVYVQCTKRWTLYLGGSAHIQYLLPILTLTSQHHPCTLTSFSAHFTAGHTLLLFQFDISNDQHGAYYIQEGQPTFHTCFPFSKSYFFPIPWHSPDSLRN